MPKLPRYERQVHPDITFHPFNVPDVLPTPRAPEIPGAVIAPESLASQAGRLALPKGRDTLAGGIQKNAMVIGAANMEQQKLAAQTRASDALSAYEMGLDRERERIQREPGDPLTMTERYQAASLQVRDEILKTLKDDPLGQQYFFTGANRLLPGEVAAGGTVSNQLYTGQQQSSILARREDQVARAANDPDMGAASDRLQAWELEFVPQAIKIFPADQVQTLVADSRKRVQLGQLGRFAQLNPDEYLLAESEGRVKVPDEAARTPLHGVAWSAKESREQARRAALAEEDRQFNKTRDELAKGFEAQIWEGKNVTAEIEAAKSRMNQPDYTRLRAQQNHMLRTNDAADDPVYFNQVIEQINRDQITSWAQFHSVVDPSRLSYGHALQANEHLRGRMDRKQAQADDNAHRQDAIRDRPTVGGRSLILSGLRFPETAKFNAQMLEGIQSEALTRYDQKVLDPTQVPYEVARQVRDSTQRVIVDVAESKNPYQTEQQVIDALRLWRDTKGREGIPPELADSWIHYFQLLNRLGKPSPEKPNPTPVPGGGTRPPGTGNAPARLMR